MEIGELPQLTGLNANDVEDENEEDEDQDDELHAQGHGGMFDTGDEEMEEELKNTLERLGIKIEDLEEDEGEDADAQLDAADRDEDEKIEQRVRVKKFKVKATNTAQEEPASKKSKCCLLACFKRHLTESSLQDWKARTTSPSDTSRARSVTCRTFRARPRFDSTACPAARLAPSPRSRYRLMTA